jgi:PleD family two-component response regulator
MLVLLAHAPDRRSSSRELEHALRPAGYTVLEAYTAPDALQQARRSRPDAIILDIALPDGDAPELCRALRIDPDITPSTPILVTTAGPTTRQQLSDALRAGANGVWGHPIDTEEFLLRLEGQLRAKCDADRAREQGLLDHETGLYNTQGLERRARELASHVDRRGAALACVVLAPDASTAGVDTTIESLGRILRSAGRGSDTIGRVGRRELAVLAPYTDAAAALRLAQRLLETAAELAGGEAPGMRAGYDVDSGFRTSLRDPAELVGRARSALAALLADGSAERIRSYADEPRTQR